MGYMKHHTIVVTSWDDDLIESAHRKAGEIFDRSISGIIQGRANGYRSFFIPPNGSKEGWELSDKNNRQRREFTSWLDEQKHGDGSTSIKWVEVQFGDERGLAKIVDDSEKHLWEDDYE